MGLVVDVLIPGRCYVCILADVSQLLFFIWQMLLPFFLWQMLLPLLCILLADVIAIFLLADVIAIVFGWWQILLPLWLLFLPLVGMLYHFVVDVIAIFVG